MPERNEIADTLTVLDEPNSAGALAEAIEEAQKAFDQYYLFCDTVDRVYSLRANYLNDTYEDAAFDLFWASMEILKPAIYAKPPKPIATPRFKDGKQVDKSVAEVIERILVSEFDRGDIDQVMLNVRDDLALTNRGAAWVRYEDGKGGKRVCVEYLDRRDFLHEPARTWSEVSWVARRAWMTKKQMLERFPKAKEDIEAAEFHSKREYREYGLVDSSAKAGVWEVWHKHDNKVYWWAPGCQNFLDEDEPHLNLWRFFPCPRPAYGTLMRRSLVPVPDYRRYREMLDNINILTERIYVLLDQVKLRVMIPGGSDVGAAVENALNAHDDMVVISVPAAAFQGAAGNGVMLTLPLTEIATTIQGLIEARNQLIENFYQVSGISDIMRGATDAGETLGAQQLKQQNGAVRVRDRIDEIARFARDLAEISAEIVAQNYDKDTIMEVSGMDFPTRAEVKKSVKDIEDAVKRELEEAGEMAEQAAMQAMESGEPVDPAMAQQQFEEVKNQIFAKYQPMIERARVAVTIEDVMELLRDKKARNLVIDIETDSTIMVDEMAEKSARAEFLQAFAGASASVQPLLAAGEAGASLAGGLLKFALQPYRANRELDQLIDDFIDEAGQMAGQAQEGDTESEELIAAQNKLAEAEMAKAQAQMAKVQADSQLKQVELQGKVQDMQLRASKDAAQFEVEREKLQLQFRKQEQEFQAKLAEQEAKTNHLQAQTAQILASIGLDVRKQDLEEYSRARGEERLDRDEARKDRSENRADRSQNVSETQATIQQREGV